MLYADQVVNETLFFAPNFSVMKVALKNFFPLLKYEANDYICQKFAPFCYKAIKIMPHSDVPGIFKLGFIFLSKVFRFLSYSIHLHRKHFPNYVLSRWYFIEKISVK